jgi:seryl-tRNA synthetase
MLFDQAKLVKKSDYRRGGNSGEKRARCEEVTQATDTDIREIRDLLLGLDKKIDGVDKKLDVHIAKTEEQFKSLGVQVSDLKTDVADIKVQLRSQDNRLWTFVGALFLAVLGFLAKFAFFPGGQP